MSTRHPIGLCSDPGEPIPFPGLKRRNREPFTTDGDAVIEGFEEVSRRIFDLARELNCLGYFEDDDDRPRAA